MLSSGRGWGVPPYPGVKPEAPVSPALTGRLPLSHQGNFFLFLASFAAVGFYGEFSSIQLVLLLTLPLVETHCYQSTDRTATSIK